MISIMITEAEIGGRERERERERGRIKTSKKNRKKTESWVGETKDVWHNIMLLQQ